MSNSVLSCLKTASLILLLGGTVQSFAQATEDGLDLLQKAGMAADSLSYSGEFVYVKDGKIATMKISHLAAGEGSSSQQKIMALDGSMREIIQQGDIVACVLPDQKTGLREKRQAQQVFKMNISDRVDLIASHYKVERVGQGRVAGRNCERLSVRPRDDYRYGYNLCIDSEKNLLLSSELIDTDDKLAESYAFVNVSFEPVDKREISSITPPASLNWMDDSNPAMPESGNQMQDILKWQVVENDTGFELEHYIRRFSPVVNNEITHLVLGDGLAQVSVFIVDAAVSNTPSGSAMSMGILNSYTLQQEEYKITVLGEAPMKTIKMIAQHIRPVEKG